MVTYMQDVVLQIKKLENDLKTFKKIFEDDIGWLARDSIINIASKLMLFHNISLRKETIQELKDESQEVYDLCNRHECLKKKFKYEWFIISSYVTNNFKF